MPGGTTQDGKEESEPMLSVMSDKGCLGGSMQDDEGEVVQPHGTGLRGAGWRTGPGAWCGLRQEATLGPQRDGE